MNVNCKTPGMRRQFNSYQFRVQSCLNHLYNNYYCEISYTYLAEGIPKVK